MKWRYSILFFISIAFLMQVVCAQKNQHQIHHFLQKLQTSHSEDSVLLYQLEIVKLYLQSGSLDSAEIYLQNFKFTTSNHPLEINALHHMVQGMYQFEIGAYQEALTHYQKSLQLYQKKSVQTYCKEWLELQNDIGRVWIVTNEIDKAQAHFQQVIQQVKSIPPKRIDTMQLSNVYNNMGVVHFYNGELDKAYQNYDYSRTLATMCGEEKSVNVGRTYYNMGLVKEEKGFLLDARLLYEKSLEIYLGKLGPYHHHIAEVYGSLGNIHLTRYELKKAKYYFQKDLEISQRIYGKDHVEATWGYENLARVYQVEKKYDQAKELFEKVYEIRNRAYNGRHIYLSNVLLSLAELETNPNLSIEIAKKAQVIEYQITKNSTIGKWNISLHLLEKYIALKKWTEAKRELIKSIGLGDKLLAQASHPLYTKTYLLGAQLNEKLNNYLESRKFFQKAIQSTLSIKHSWNGEDFMPLKDIYYIPEFIEAITQMANFNIQHGTYSDWMTSSKWIKHTDRLIQLHQKRRTSDDISKNHSAIYKNLYESGAITHSLLWERFQDFKYLEEIFDYTEKIKQLQILDDLQGMDAYRLSNLPETTLRKEYQLKKDILYYQSLIEEKHEEDAFITQKLMALYREEEEFYKKLERFHPDYYRAKYDIKTITLAEIQKSYLKKKDLLWHTTRIGEDDFVFGVTQHHVVFKKLKENEVKSFIQDLLKQDVQHWIVIPDYSIPWKSLEVYKSKGRYLIEDYSFIYNVSAKSYFQKTKNSAIVNRKILAMAPVTFTHQQLKELKKSKQEIEELSQFFKVKTYIGKDAHKDAFFKNSLLYGGLHIATHISYNELNPLRSKLYLTPRDSSDDGILYAHEIYGVPMRTQLVTLSACQGKKDAFHHSGIAGIADAFFYNGCKNILMSLWDVEDQVMKEITVGFYKYLSKGYSKSKALQLSKRDYLNQADRYKSHPYYWSGIILQGDHQKIGLTPSFWSKNWKILAMILFVAGLYFVLRFRRE